MAETSTGRPDSHGLSERVLTEIMRTPALKELVILMMKDIDPDAAPGLVRTALWGEAGVSLSLFGAIPDMVNWLLELLLELGRQLNALPEALLREFLVKVGEGVDAQRLEQLPEVYCRLAKRLLMGDEAGAADAGELAAKAANRALDGVDRLTSRLDADREQVASAVAVCLDRVDTATLGRSLNRLLALANAVRRARRVTLMDRLRPLLGEIDTREVLAALGGAARSCAAAARVLLSKALRSRG